MPYEIHAYCTREPVPTIRQLLDYLRDENDGWGVEADAPETSARGLDSPRWKEVFLRYGRKGKAMESLTLGCYRNTSSRSLCAKMAKGRLETISAYRDSPGKRKVADCLSRTRFVVWCRVDNDGDRDRASSVLDMLASLLSRCDAVFDMEDEGFLADSDTPLCGWCNHDE